MSLNRSISGLKILLSAKDTKAILTNFFSLGIIQGTNFLLPLIVLPYLISVVGLAKYGVVALAQSFVFYWTMFTDYGFNLSTTREIALFKEDPKKISEIVSSTIFAKSLLCLIALFGFIVLVNAVPVFFQNRRLYYFGFIMVIGQSLIPVWFFQGIEQMKYITFINVAGKIIQTALIFLLVKLPSDFVYVLLFYGLGSLIAGIFGIWLMFSRFKVSLQPLNRKSVLHELKKGWYIFLSHFSINICTNSNIFILGFFANEITIGYYSIAEKAVSIVRQLLMIFFQATYPAICKQVVKGQRFVRSFFHSYFIPFASGIVILCIAIFLFADYITVFFVGHSVTEITSSIRWMIIMPVIVCLNMPAFQTLLAYNYQKSYMLIFVLGSALNIALNLTLARYFLIAGTIMSVVLTEVFITAGLYAILYFRYPDKMVWRE